VGSKVSPVASSPVGLDEGGTEVPGGGWLEQLEKKEMKV